MNSMNYYQAHKLLDETRNGHNHPEADITSALELTGDIDRELCGDSPGWRRRGAEGWVARSAAASFFGIGQRVSGIESHDHRTN